MAPHFFAPHFFTAPDFDFAARTALGHAALGTSDIGPILAVLSRIADGDAAGWYAAWRTEADRLRAAADTARKAGHDLTASALYLSASEFYDQSFVLRRRPARHLRPSAHLPRPPRGVGRLRRHLPWSPLAGTGALRGRRDARLPVPPGRERRRHRPTLVVTNGSDGALSGLWATAIRPALDRGWNAFVFDGPGQQSMLFERDIPFRHDWEAVLTPVVDVLVDRADVDASALLAYAISQGGYWLPRALAFEHRFVAAVADGGVVDVARAWNVNLPPALLALLRAGDRDRFNAAIGAGPSDPAREREFAFRAKPYGGATPFDTFAAAQRFTLHGVTDSITTPLLILDPEDEQFFPGQPQ